MPTVHETAYPRLKSSVTRRELIDLYTPTEAEVELAGRVSKGPSAKVPFLIRGVAFDVETYFRLHFVFEPLSFHDPLQP